MIARSQTRTTPIPFDATPVAPQARQTRAINWSGSSNPSAPSLSSMAAAGTNTRPAAVLGGNKVSLSGHLPLSAQGVQAPAQHAANMPRLSPVKVPLTFNAPAAPVATPTGRKAEARQLTEISARYTGQGSLSVRSSVTGRHYRFQGHGDCVIIDKSDVVLLRRIADLDIR